MVSSSFRRAAFPHTSAARYERSCRTPRSKRLPQTVIEAGGDVVRDLSSVLDPEQLAELVYTTMAQKLREP